MTKILIIEDEAPARRKLRRFLEEVESPIEILAEIDTVEAATAFLKKKQPDLIFSDIELLDGNAFDIYRVVLVSCPIIFTTAYNQFWLDAFEGNGIAYLLKPFSKDQFLQAWNKFRLLKSPITDKQHTIDNLTDLIRQYLPEKPYKKRFTIHMHQEIYFLDTESVLFFEADGGVLFAYTSQGKRHLLTEATLKELEGQLNPSDFFRINRSELVQKHFIEKIERFNKNSLIVKLKGHERYLKTSQSQTAAFREWLEK